MQVLFDCSRPAVLFCGTQPISTSSGVTHCHAHTNQKEPRREIRNSVMAAQSTWSHISTPPLLRLLAPARSTHSRCRRAQVVRRAKAIKWQRVRVSTPIPIRTAIVSASASAMAWLRKFAD